MEQTLDALRDYILATINPVIASLSTSAIPLKALTSTTVIQGIPDTDKYQDAVTFFIEPTQESYESMTMASLEVTLSADVFVVVRKASPDVLYKQALRYSAALKSILASDPSLGGGVDEAHVENLQYYSGVEGTQDIQAVKVTLSIVYEE